MPRNRAKESANPRDDWGTPWGVFLEISKAFESIGRKFYIDVAADAFNTKLPFFIDEKQNALSVNWGVDNSGLWWCNPPFSQVEAFLDHAWAQFKTYGNQGVMLVPSNQETGWFRRCVTHRNLPRFVWHNRIKFIDPLPPTINPKTGKLKKRDSNVVGSVIVAFCDFTLPTVDGIEPWVGSLPG